MLVAGSLFRVLLELPRKVTAMKRIITTPGQPCRTGREALMQALLILVLRRPGADLPSGGGAQGQVWRLSLLVLVVPRDVGIAV